MLRRRALAAGLFIRLPTRGRQTRLPGERAVVPIKGLLDNGSGLPARPYRVLPGAELSGSGHLGDDVCVTVAYSSHVN